MRQQHVRPTIESLETRSLLSVVAVELGHHHVGAHAEHVRRDVEHVRKEFEARPEGSSYPDDASFVRGWNDFNHNRYDRVPPTGVAASPVSPTSSPTSPTASPTSPTTSPPAPTPSPTPTPTPSPTPTPTPTPTPPPTGSPTPGPGTPTSPTSSPIASPVKISVTTNQAVYTPGQTVTMTFTETNDSNSSIRVPIGPSIDGFTITSGGKTVWRSNSGIEPAVHRAREYRTGRVDHADGDLDRERGGRNLHRARISWIPMPLLPHLRSSRVPPLRDETPWSVRNWWS